MSSNNAYIVEDDEIVGDSEIRVTKRIEVLNEKELNDAFEFKSVENENVLASATNYIKKYYKPSGGCMANYIQARLPVINLIRNYNLKQDFVKDLIAGLIVGIVQIPQGMAYAVMAGVPAINGLYVSFFNVLMYVFLGTSKHLSTGTHAIVSLIVASTVKQYAGILYPLPSSITTPSPTTSTVSIFDESSSTPEYYTSQSSAEISTTTIITSTITTTPASSSSNFISNDPEKGAVLLAMALSFYVGILQIILGTLHVGFVTKFLSDSIVKGFTCGAAFHVILSQIGPLLGLKLTGFEIPPFVAIGNIIDIFRNLLNTNGTTVVISFFSCAFLYIVKTRVNDKYKAKLPVPIPVELVVVVVGTGLSYVLDFESRGVKIVGFLPSGMPSPELPPVQIISDVIGSAISIAIVSFAVNVSMAKLFAKKYKYDIRPNQELFAYGAGNLLTSFFSGFPSCVGLARCVIFESVDGRTQLNGIFGSILLLIVILFLGPLFQTLPNACLASIIVVALKNMAMEFTIFPQLYKKSRLEALAWLATYAGVVLLNVDIGLYVGLGSTLLLFIFRTQRPRACVLGNIPGTNIYEDIKVCEAAKEFDGIKIIRYEESIYFANVENFKYKIHKLSGVNPAKVMQKKKKRKESITDLEGQTRDVVPLKDLIIDMSCVNYIDSQGALTIEQLVDAYHEIGIHVYISYCKRSVIRLFSKYGVNLCHSKIFASTSETVRYVRNSNLKTITCDGITSISSEHETTEEDAQNNPENEERINAENVPESRIEYTRAADDDDSSFVEPELDEKAHF